MNKNYIFPAALKHSDIQEVFPGIYFVTGSCDFNGPMKLRFSRNMTILKQNDELTLVNTVRLTEKGLQQLDSLGAVKHIIRLAGFHGMDDPFYKDRYDATVWSVDAPYTKKLDGPSMEESTYFTADIIINNDTELPVENSSLYCFNSTTPGEALLLLNRDGGILIAGDSLQNWQKADKYFGFFTKIIMKRKGFIKPYNIGPGWLKFAKPSKAEMQGILDLSFESVLPAHGTIAYREAKACFAKSINQIIN